MAEPSALLGLPNELIHAILECTDTAYLLTLCQTNQRIHGLCLDWIYRSVHLNDPVRLLKFCENVILRKEAADAVRKFKTSCPTKDAAAVENFYITWKSAFGRMKNIQELCVASFALFHLIYDLRFHNLSICSIPCSGQIIPFLKQHPTITWLSVYLWYEEEGEKDDRDVASEFTSLSQPIYMPNLRQFSGPATVAYAVMPGAPTFDMGIYWLNHDITGKTFSDILGALARMNAVGGLLTNLLSSWDSSFILAIVDHMPRVRKLHLQNMMELEDDSEEKALFISSVEGALSALPELESLTIIGRSPPTSESYDDLDTEFDIVCRWADHSPSLSVAILSENTRWMRLVNVWFPTLRSGGNGEVADCHYRWFFKKVITTSTLPPMYAHMAQFLAGPDGMLSAKRAIEKTGAVPDFVVAPGGDTVITFAEVDI
ncbi:hypothetical protein B0H11DRAFT_2063162 [Mycena galericulata]|nr:hypothetical protein B0H11DRAFT_2063162 [Mycena galericulata]